MTTEELQQLYLEAVGRPTSSSNAAYLQWKVREAEKGKVPVGPLSGRGRPEDGVDVKVLPLRIESSVVVRIDRAWRTGGLRSRTDFFRQAIGHYLQHLTAAPSAPTCSTEAAE